MKIQQIYEIVRDNLPIGFSMVDKDGIIVDFNPATEEITSYSRDEVIGKPHFEILHGTSDKYSCPLLKHALSQKEKTVAVEAMIKKKSGEQIALSVTAFPLFDGNRDLSGAVELFRDISETKRREREQKNILSMFAHDMKNPVTTAGGFLSRLLSGKPGEVTEKQKSYLKTIREELYKVSDLIADFLEFSRIEAKAHIPVPRPFDIRKEMQGAIEEADGEILISVIDTGRGVPEDKLPYLFDAFYHISRDTKGSGLGLFIAKTIVEAHGGRMWAESKPGKGSTFSVILPKN